MNRLLCVLFLGSIAAIAPSWAAIISLGAPSEPGSAFDVFVHVTGVFDAPHQSDSLLGYGFNVSFDSSRLSYLGETPGAMFDDISNNPGIMARVAGVASMILLGPGDVVEPLNLAVLRFGVTTGGATSISITGDPSNLDQGLIYLGGSDPISASASVSLTATPESRTAYLLGFGFLAIWAGRRIFAARPLGN
jgi:hypothetical protein